MKRVGKTKVQVLDALIVLIIGGGFAAFLLNRQFEPYTFSTLTAGSTTACWVYVGVVAFSILTGAVIAFFRLPVVAAGLISVVLAAFMATSPRSLIKYRDYRPDDTAYKFNTGISYGQAELFLNGQSFGIIPATTSGKEIETAFTTPFTPAEGVQNAWYRLELPVTTAPRGKHELVTKAIWCKIVCNGVPREIVELDAYPNWTNRHEERSIICKLRLKAHKSNTYDYLSDMVRYAQVCDYKVPEQWINDLSQTPYARSRFGNNADPALQPLFGQVFLMKYGLKSSDPFDDFIDLAGHYITGTSGMFPNNLEFITLCEQTNDLPFMLSEMIRIFNTPFQQRTQQESQKWSYLVALLPTLCNQLNQLKTMDAETRRLVDELGVAICRRGPDEMVLKQAIELPSPLIEEFFCRKFRASGKWVWRPQDSEQGISHRDSIRISLDFDGPIINKWLHFAMMQKGNRGKELMSTYRSDLLNAGRVLLSEQLDESRPLSATLLFDHHKGSESMSNELLQEFFGAALKQSRDSEDQKEFLTNYLKPMGDSLDPKNMVACMKTYMNASSSKGDILDCLKWTSREKRIKILNQVKQLLNEKPPRQDVDKKSWENAINNGLIQCGMPSAINTYVVTTNKSPNQLSELLLPYPERKWGPKYFYSNIIAALRISDDSKQHLILLDYISRVPTPENRAMLTDMTWNSDPSVQKRVAEVKAELEELKNNMPESPYEELFEKGTTD
ncbi:hypothetical protein BVX99_01025 [bacterium F16]|nr:hypothetical protein BVX99_01025 [bacterium F16]